MSVQHVSEILDVAGLNGPGKCTNPLQEVCCS